MTSRASSSKSMGQHRVHRKLSSQWESQNRYSNFGPVLCKYTIKGFRGITDLTLDLEFPITALSGLNGTGKSTFCQLASCGYRKSENSDKRFYVRDFFPVSPADPAPFTHDASIIYMYQTSQSSNLQTVTVKRTNTQWSGYKRQPEKCVYYIGFTLYLPKIERKDLSIYRGEAIQLGNQRNIADCANTWMGKILDRPYESVHIQSYSHKNRQAELGMARTRSGQYSENHMGCGEARMLHMINLFETAPEKSLFILEEPEVSLHEHAQKQVVDYFLDVIKRRHHQIILSTHSSVILDSLPSEARKFLYRDEDSLRCLSRISPAHAHSILSGRSTPALIVCVEDSFARSLLTEILRKFRSGLLGHVDIVPIGGKNEVANTIRALNNFNERQIKSIIAIRDGDTGEDKQNNLLSFKDLPGHDGKSPEEAIFSNSHVKEGLANHFGPEVNSFFHLNSESDFHKIPKNLANQVKENPETVIHLANKYYCANLNKSQCQYIIDAIENAM